MQDVRLTVVMPMRNAAGTLEETLRSLSRVRLNDRWELIGVDDHSEDGTAELFEQLTDEFQLPARLLVLPSGERGTAVAGNAALAVARGKYMIRCDADDTVPPDAYRRLLEAADACKADIVAGAITRLTGDGKTVKQELLIQEGEPGNLNDMPIDTVHFSLCNKIIRRELIEPFFAGVDRWEDLGVVARAFALAKRIVYIEDPVYEYHVDRGRRSLSRSSKHELLRDHIACAEALCRWLDEHGWRDRYKTFVRHLLFAAKAKYARRPKRDLRAWKRTFAEVNRHVLALKHVPLPYRLLFAAVAVMPERLLPGQSAE